MGLLDLFRRRPDRTDAPVSAEHGVAYDGGSESATSSTEASVQRSADAGGDAAPTPTAPRAWELLRPLVPLSHTPIHRTFDAHPGASLRTQRRADDLFVSSSLGHTVDPAASGTVDGLMQVTAAGALRDFPAFGSGGDRVLRRRTLGTDELASADQSHPRWPIFAAATRAATAAVSTPAAPSLARSSADASVARSVDADVFRSSEHAPLGEPEARVEADLARGADLFDAAGSGDSLGTTDGGGGGVGSVRRSADLVGAAPLTSASLPMLRSSLARSLDVVSDAPRPSLITRVAADSPAPIAQARTVASSTAGSAPVARVVEGSIRPTLAATASNSPTIARTADDGDGGVETAALGGPIARSLATGPSPTSAPDGASAATPSAAVLRRRSIVEVRSDSGGSASLGSTDSSSSSPSAPSGSSDDSGIALRAYDASESSVQRTESAASVPTLGRRAGLGAPMTELPSSAAPDGGSGEPFGAVYGQDHFDAMLRRANRVDRAVETDGAGNATSTSRTVSPSANVVGFSNAAESAGGGTSSSPFPILRVVNDDEPSSDSHDLGGAASSANVQPIGSDSGRVLRSAVSGSSSSSNAVDATAAIHRSMDLPLVGARALTLASGPSAPVLSGLGGAVQAQGPAAVPLQRSPAAPVVSAPTFSTRLGATQEAAATIDDASFGGNSSSFEHVIARSVTPVPSLGAPSIGVTAPSGAVPVLPLLRSVDDSTRSSTAAFGGAVTAAPGLLPSVRGVVGGGGDGSPGSVQRTISGMSTPPSIQPVAPPPQSQASQPNVSPASTTPAASSAQSPAEMSAAQPASGDAGGSAGGGESSGGGDAGDGAGGGGASTGGGSGAGPSSATAEAELDQLAGKLYERLRFRLRRELLDDRERAGLVLDRVR